MNLEDKGVPMEEVENNEDLTSEDSPKFSRRSRTADHRSARSRAGDERAPIVFAHVSQFNIDETTRADKRYKFGYVPYIVGNDEVHLPYDNAVRKGWEKAPASEYSQLRRIHDDPFRRRDAEDDFIRNGGQLMMRRPIEIDEAEDQHYIEENAHRDKMIAAHQIDTPGGMQVFSQSRTRGVGVRRI